MTVLKRGAEITYAVLTHIQANALRLMLEVETQRKRLNCIGAIGTECKVFVHR